MYYYTGMPNHFKCAKANKNSDEFCFACFFFNIFVVCVCVCVCVCVWNSK